MDISNGDRISLLLFVLSTMVFVFLYGFLVGTLEWFPSGVLKRAWKQAKSQAQRYHLFSRRLDKRPPGFLNPRVYDRKGVRIPQPGKVQSGLRLISSAWKDSKGWDPRLRLMNERGKILHEWKIDREKYFRDSLVQRKDPGKTDVHGSLLLPNGDVVVNLEYIGTVRLDSCGKVIWTLAEGNHHSIARTGDGSFWVPGVSPEPTSSSPQFPDGFPGLRSPVWVDRLLKVSGDGTVQKDIKVLDVLYRNDLERYIAKAKLIGENFISNRKDITHLNDVEPLPPYMADEYPRFDRGDLVVSLLRPSLVFVLDPESKRVKWHASGDFIHQHDPDFTGNGWIGVFDNNRDLTWRGALTGGSRIVALRPFRDDVKVQFPTANSEPFYTSTQGKWQQLDNGNLLLTETKAGRVVEVDPSGRTVWEWIHESYGDSIVPSVTKGSLYEWEPDDVAGWPCSSVNSGTPTGESP